ncbi:MAG: cytochrome oxidase mono-heme subunit/FixO [Verrucomicrobiaceae bacterium]|nr:cytochrome oxidase mono-heme subunit/FixO [Verrucomicrobiaceae bacterium]
MTDFRTFVLKLIASFGLPWLVLIIIPSIQYQGLKPIAYDKDKGDELDNGYYYPLSPVVNQQGERIYAAEGCVQCHSQMVRPAALGLDAWHQGWGQDQSAHSADPIRASQLRDYLGEKHSFLGVIRNGPDLANAGYRFENRTQVHLHLYEPKVVNPGYWQVMPSYRHLYEVRKIQGQGAANALPLKDTAFEPAAGYEVVPSQEAEQLVSYILSLKKDYPTPGSAKAAGAPAAKK